MPTEQIDLESATTRVNGILHDSRRGYLEPDANPAPAPTRRKRSDAGTKRPAKPQPAPAGVLSEQQWARLSVLVETVTRAAVDLRDASDRHSRATAEYRDYLDALKGA